jgi:Tfp pilus assembly protein PilF
MWSDSTFALAIVLACCLAGCAGSRQHVDAHSAASAADRQREQAAVQAFEQRRDEAQLQAALDRWQQGDLAGCELRLRSLLARRPDYCDAHLQLAELAWSCQNAVEAEAEYRAALSLAPERADLHHALGLVLEATGRGQEARHHLAQACALDPHSDLYRSTAAAVGSIGTLAAPPRGGDLAVHGPAAYWR